MVEIWSADLQPARQHRHASDDAREKEFSVALGEALNQLRPDVSCFRGKWCVDMRLPVASTHVCMCSLFVGFVFVMYLSCVVLALLVAIMLGAGT